MNITDAKPVLPVSGTVESVSITFNEVSVHKSGGGWITLPAVQQPYTIDLYQFSNGAETQFVPPVQLESGRYTQVRIGVTSATIQINENGEIKKLDLIIPSENLKTDKNFEFDVQGGGGVDLTVDFDLSQSIVVTGSGTYQLKPVLHINETSEAATIEGTINWGSSTQATVTVTWDKNPNENPNPLDPNNDEEYTKVTVLISETSPFQIFWLVPDQGYFVKVELSDGTSTRTYQEYVAPGNLGEGAIYKLNNDKPIWISRLKNSNSFDKVLEA